MAEVTEALEGIDLGDRGTQIMLAAGAIGVGLLIAKMRGASAPAAAPVDARPIQVEVPGGWGSRADMQNVPGAFGWVGNGNVTQPETEKPDSKNPKPTDPNPTDTTGMKFSVSQGTIQKGGSVSVSLGGLQMNEQVDVFLDNTTGAPAKTFVINASGGASGSVTIPATYPGKSVYLVAQSRRSGATKTASVSLVEAAKPTTPTPTTPKPTPTTPVASNPKATASPASATPGAKVTITVSGFASGETVSIKAQHWNVSASVKVNTSGSGSAIITVPGNAAPGNTSAVATGATSKKSASAPFAIGGATGTGKTKFGRTEVKAQASWPYSCPVGSTMVQEPGSPQNHVCERNDNGQLFQVQYKNRGGEALGEGVTVPGLMSVGGFGSVPVPIIAETHARIKAGETLRELAQRVYGTDAGIAVLGMLNPDLVSMDSVTEGTTFRVR